MSQIQEEGTHIQKKEAMSKKERMVARTSLWIALIAALGCGFLYYLLPQKIILGPSWLPLALIIVLMLPVLIAQVIQHPLPYPMARLFTLIILGVVTLVLVIGVVVLVVTLPNRTQAQAGALFRTGAILWIANILVFSLWYWEIDGGGPQARRQSGHQAADFMFPQQTEGNSQKWAPHYLDYLFVAFTGTTALSPTDTFPLTIRAKGLMIIQAVIALVLLTIIIGRVVNIL